MQCMTAAVEAQYNWRRQATQECEEFWASQKNKSILRNTPSQIPNTLTKIQNTSTPIQNTAPPNKQTSSMYLLSHARGPPISFLATLVDLLFTPVSKSVAQ